MRGGTSCWQPAKAWHLRLYSPERTSSIFSDPRINAARVAGRVMLGGHTVPIEKILARYSRSMANLCIAFELADRVYVYDNSPDGVDAVLGARIQNAQLRKIYGPLPAWIADSVEELPRHPDFVDLRSADHQKKLRYHTE